MVRLILFSYDGRDAGLPSGFVDRMVPFLVLVFLLSSTPLHQVEAQLFSQVTTVTFPSVALSDVSWSDYNRDLYPDILVTGTTQIAKLFRNEQGNGTFTEITTAGFLGVSNPAAAWGDYDKDTYQDVVITGSTTGTTAFTKLYRNVGGTGTFTEVTTAVFQAVYGGQVAWGDYNGDGWLDIVLGGGIASTYYFKLYRNMNGGGTFNDVTPASLPTTLAKGTVAWADYDQDGRQDLFVIGATAAVGPWMSKLYRNVDNAGTFSEVAANTFYALTSVAAAWGDYNGDGWLDIAYSGYVNTTLNMAKLYRNMNGTGTFTDVTPAVFPKLQSGSLSWGDYDNDGWKDLVITGYDGAFTQTTKVLRNNQGTFVDSGEVLVGVASGKATNWGDFNNDNYLDLLLTSSPTRLYRNTPASPSATPSQSTSPSSSITPSSSATASITSSIVPTPSMTPSSTRSPSPSPSSSPVYNYSFPVNMGVSGLQVADMNSDANLDIVLASADSSDIRVLSQVASAPLQFSQTSYTIPLPSQSPSSK